MGTTSTSIESMTRVELVKAALRMVGNPSPSPNEMSEAVLKLCILSKSVDIRGRWLWAVSNTPTTLALSVGVSSYEAGSGSGKIPVNILELEHVDLIDNNTKVELDIIDKTRSLNTPNRNLTGSPSEVYLETAAKMEDQKLWVFPEPSAGADLEIYYRRRLFDFTGAQDNPDMPGECVDYLIKALAAELSPEYGTPLSERNDLRLMAGEALRVLKGSNSEEAPTQTIETVYF